MGLKDRWEFFSNHLNDLSNLALHSLEVRSTVLIFPACHIGDSGHKEISRGASKLSVEVGIQFSIVFSWVLQQFTAFHMQMVSYAIIWFSAFQKECHRRAASCVLLCCCPGDIWRALRQSRISEDSKEQRLEQKGWVLQYSCSVETLEWCMNWDFSSEFFPRVSSQYVR